MAERYADFKNSSISDINPWVETSEVKYLSVTSHSYLQDFGLGQRSSISGPRRPNNWPAEQLQNAEEIYYIFFKIYFSVLTIYIIIND